MHESRIVYDCVFLQIIDVFQAREEYRFLRVAIFCVFNVEISCLRRKNRISWQIVCPMGFQLQTCQGNKQPLALINCLLLLVLINESIICCDHYISII